MQTADQLPAKRGRGRPSKYTPELIAKAWKYVHHYAETGDVVPSLAGLSQELNLNRETVHAWANDKNKREFSNIVRDIKSQQERALINGGLKSEYNPTIAKLMLSKHGYTENNANNQGNSGITVQVNRGGVVLKSGGQTLEVSTDQTTGRTIDHED